MKIKFKVPEYDGKKNYESGARIHDVPDEQGRAYIERGLAVEVHEIPKMEKRPVGRPPSGMGEPKPEMEESSEEE